MWVLCLGQIGDVGFCGGRKPSKPRGKPSKLGGNKKQTHPHMAPGRIQPGLPLSLKKALTTEPTLLPVVWYTRFGC